MQPGGGRRTSQLRLVIERRRQVAGDELRELVDAIGEGRLRPAGDVDVELCPIALGQRVVGHVADEDVAEAELGRAGQRRRLPRHDELLDPQAAQKVARRARTQATDVGEQDVPEDAPDDGRVLRHPLLLAGQPVEASGEDGLHRGGHFDLLDWSRQLPGAVRRPEDAAIDEHPDELLGEERVAVGQADDPFTERRRAGRRQAGRR